MYIKFVDMFVSRREKSETRGHDYLEVPLSLYLEVFGRIERYRFRELT